MKKYLWHCHHADLIEEQEDSVNNRKSYIKTDKPPAEVPLRLLLFKVAKVKKGEQFDAVTEYIHVGRTVTNTLRKMHKEQCIPDCPWSARKGAIFTKFSVRLNRWVTKTGR